MKKSHPRPHRKCPCGSKKKYRNCCGQNNRAISSNDLSKEKQDLFKKLKEKRNIAEIYHKQHFGNTPPIISCTFNGRRVVAIGSRLISNDSKYDWNHPTDFLMSYLKTTLGFDWLESELGKSQKEQHTIARWFLEGNSNIEHSRGNKRDQINGAALSLLHLAYDLFVLDNMNNLPDRLINRIKNLQNFNGARYEAFVFATLVRAGFQVEYEDEKSGLKGKVPECRAKHIDTSVYLSIEAKTKNIKGVLGSKEGKKSKLNLYEKLKKAIEKDIDEPYIVFIDLNLPDFRINNGDISIEKIRNELKKLESNKPKLMPNLIFFTNIPFHYAKNDEAPKELAFGCIIPNKPRVHIPDNIKVKIVNSILDSLNKYAYLPKEFNEENVFSDRLLEEK